jgi:hypothetical protein
VSDQLLPKHLLARVLQLLDLPQRLGSCAIVSRAWCAAAAAASSNLQLTVNRKAQAKQLYQWLSSDRHSSGIQGLTLDSKLAARNGRLDVCLPLQQLPLLHGLNLRRLTLHCSSNFSAEVASSSGSATTASSSSHSSSNSSSNAFAPLASTLTALRLDTINLSGFPGGLCSLSVLTSLQQLAVKIPCDQEASTQQTAALAAGLGQLTQLKSLRVNNADRSCSALAAAISQLQQLQQLRVSIAQQRLTGRWQPDPQGLGAYSLPRGLTSLELGGFGDFLPRQQTWLAHLPLQHVMMRNTLVGDCLSTHMPRLTSLVLGFEAGGDAYMTMRSSATPAQPFVDMFQHATRLQRLDLLYIVDGRQLLTSADCCAILRAVQLTKLRFCNTMFEMGAVPAMLEAAAGPEFAQLQELSFEGCRATFLMWMAPKHCLQQLPSAVSSGTYRPPAAIPSSSLSLFAHGWPHLRRLSIVDSLQRDNGSSTAGCSASPPIAALLQLRSLSSLCIDDNSGDVITDAAVGSVLAGMTGLRELVLGGCSKLTQQGLVGLTQLRGLRHLAVRGMGGGCEDVALQSQVGGVMQWCRAVRRFGKHVVPPWLWHAWRDLLAEQFLQALQPLSSHA